MAAGGTGRAKGRVRWPLPSLKVLLPLRQFHPTLPFSPRPVEDSSSLRSTAGRRLHLAGLDARALAFPGRSGRDSAESPAWLGPLPPPRPLFGGSRLSRFLPFHPQL